MKLKKGQKVYHRNRKYTDNVPDNIAEELGLMKKPEPNILKAEKNKN